MDKEKILQIKGMLTEIEQFKESSSEITIVSKDNILRVDGEVMAAMMSAAIIVLENQLDIAKFGKPSDNLEDSREFKAARALEDAINSFSFNPDRFAEAIPYMHRTLQQNFFRLVRSCVCKMANVELWRIDPRNEASHKMCKAIAEPMSEYSLPYI